MHFDPVGSEQSSTTDIREFPEGDVLARDARQSDRTSDIDRGQAIAAVGSGSDADDAFHGDDDDEVDEDDEHEEPPSPVRQGLPSRFRMRHTPHYVDELLGDAPLRTVREIPVSEIESPIDDLAELEELERSIRQLGVIEPLLVNQRGRRDASYRVIAGMRRLRAAQRVGLHTVPCLVHDVDEDRLTDMRDAAARRLSVPPAPAPEPEPEAVSVAPDVPQITQPAVGEAALGLEFVAALLPAMNAAGGDRLRWGVLTDLASVELSRTKAIGAAHEILRSARPIDRASVDYQLLVSGVVAGVAAEARLRNVRLDVSMRGGCAGRDIFLDGALCRDALAGLVQSLLGLAPRAGTVLGVAAQITSIRPALIVECLLHESDPELGPETLSRFFDAGWREHPCGSNRGAVLAAFAHVARAHGGRVEIKAAARGCLATFVVPRIDG